MSSMAISLGLGQAQSPGTLNVQVVETVAPDFFLPLAAGRASPLLVYSPRQRIAGSTRFKAMRLRVNR